MTQTYTVADYLLDRLAQIGIRHFFGVPGITTCNSSITFSLIRNHPGRLRQRAERRLCRRRLRSLQTGGGAAHHLWCGELSALNGVAGSYAEYLPVIHVVGTPAQRAQRAGDLLHHSLGMATLPTSPG